MSPRQVTDSADASDAENYTRNYEGLKRWIISTLEKYRQDLERALFPAFKYLYLEMLKHSLADKAQEFYTRYHADHPYSDELGKLQTLDSIQKLNTDLGRSFLETRTQLQISRYALQLLLSFIESESYSLVFWVLNKYVDFEVTQDPIGSKAVLLDDDSKLVRNSEHMVLNGYGEELKTNRREPARASFSRPLHFVEKRREEDQASRLHLGEDSVGSVCLHTVLQADWTCLSADVSEDGRHVLCGFEDGCVRLWDMGKGGEWRVFRGHCGGVFSVRFSPCNRLFVSASEDSTVRLWSLVSMSNVAVLKGHVFPVWTLAFSLQGYYFASGGADHTARVWVTDSTAPVRIFAGHFGEVTCVKFHPNGLYLGTCSSDKTVRIWDISAATCVRLLAGHCVSVTAIEFGITGKCVVSADEEGKVVMWSIADAAVIWESEMGCVVTSIAVSREDALVSVTSSESRVVLLHFPSGRVLLDCPTKQTAVLTSTFTWRDLLVAVGVYRET